MLWQIIVVFANSFIVFGIGLNYMGLGAKLFPSRYDVGAGAMLFGVLGILVSILMVRDAKRNKTLNAPDKF